MSEKPITRVSTTFDYDCENCETILTVPIDVFLYVTNSRVICQNCEAEYRFNMSVERVDGSTEKGENLG